MTQYNGELLDEIVKAGEILDRAKTPIMVMPVRNKEVLRILKEHMPIDEMTKEASDKDDKISENPA